jgi:hypothetical protein
VSQAGPSNDINAGSPGSQKAPTQIPASLVQPLACALWRRLPHQDAEGDPRQDQAGAGARAPIATAEAICGTFVQMITNAPRPWQTTPGLALRPGR